MSDIGETVTGKLGPLPVWAWGGIAAAVSLGVYFLYRGKSSGTASAGSIVQTPATSDGSDYATSGLSSNGGSAGTITSSDSIVDWITRSASALSGQSGLSASDVIATLTHWWQGDTLTSAQKAVVDRAIQLQGQPPELPQAISAIKDPTVPVTPAKPTPPAAAAKFIGYVRAPVGTIAAIYSDHTRKDFTSYAKYAVFLAKHPGAHPNVSIAEFNSYRLTGQNPTS